MRTGVDTSSFRDRNVELVPEIPEMGGPWSPMHLTDREIVYAQGYKRKKRTLCSTIVKKLFIQKILFALNQNSKTS